MQQEHTILSSVEAGKLEEVFSRGPIDLDPAMLAWISGGVMPAVELPRATW